MPAWPGQRFSFPSDSFKSGSWLARIRENVRLLLTLHPAAPTSANGAPIHLLDTRSARPSNRAQGASFLFHFAAGMAIFLFLTYVPLPKNPPPLPVPVDTYLPAPALTSLHVLLPSEGMKGGSGANNPVPATRGNLVFSRIQLLKPHLPDQRTHSLPVQPSLQDDQAPDITPAPTKLGLPWMKDFTNSGGPGPGDSIGRGKNGDMGDEDGHYAGRGNNRGPYNPGVTPVMCAYCPDPRYTDEARKAKLQGTVTLRVLVERDGRASDIRIASGLGLGLDERAVETVRVWRFVPAKDAAHNPVPSWVTIEAVYRLF